MSGTLRLEPVLDLKAAGPLKEAFLAMRGQPVEVDASGVQRLGGLCLQVLLSARRTWAADGADFRIADASTAFAETMTLFGAEARMGATNPMGGQ